jgi:hypothetical protein
MVNFVLSSLPTFYMCAIKVPIDILNQIDKYRRHCLWRSGDVDSKKNSTSSMEDGNKIQNERRFGVINLSLQNDAMLLKTLHKFFNKACLPWVHLLWNQYYSK